MQTGLLFLMAAIVSATENAAVTGTWQCSAPVPGGGDRHWTLDFTTDEGRLTGTVRDEAATRHLTSVHFENGRLSFHLPDGDRTLRVSVKLDGDSFAGEWRYDDAKGEMQGRREPPPVTEQ